MTNSEFLDYVRTSLEKGHSRDSIRRSLKEHGWPASEIESAFREISGEKVPEIPDYRTPVSANRPAAPQKTSSSHGKYFSLNDGERVVFESKPETGLKWYLFISSILALFVFLVVFGLWGLAVMLVNPYWSGLSMIIFAVMFLILLADYIIIRRVYNMRYYWISTQRIIVKRGFIGYSINSIPLERVSDVLISRSLLERIFGFGSLHVQTLAGQYTMRGRFGAEGNLQAIPEPENNQHLIFDLITKRRKDARITM